MRKDLFDGSVEINGPQENNQALLSIPTCKGLILFADSDDRPIQILTAANIRRTASNRTSPLESPVTSSRADISKITRKIYYCCCYNDFATNLKLIHLAPEIFPESFTDIIKLPQRTYVKINLAAQWPVFYTTADSSVKTNEKVFGFFATAKSSQKFVKILEEVFNLCRKPSLIDSPHKAKSCPYLQMNQCSAPCTGNVSRNHYLTRIADAIDTAEGNTHIQKDRLRAKMKKFSNNMDFESAQAVKKQLDHLNILEKPEYLWTGDLTSLSILHIDKSAKIQISKKRKKAQSYTSFIITYGLIAQFNEFTLEQIENFAESLKNTLRNPHKTTGSSFNDRNLSLIGFFLYRNNPSGLWLNCRDIKEPINADKIEQLIRSHFEIDKKPPPRRKK